MNSNGWRDICFSRTISFASATLAFIASVNPCAAQDAGTDTRRFDLRIENGQLADHSKTIRVKRGDIVELSWSVDRRTVLHLHGYDIEIIADAGAPQIMSFKARASGRFAIETHGEDVGGVPRHAMLIYLEVHPR